MTTGWGVSVTIPGAQASRRVGERVEPTYIGSCHGELNKHPCRKSEHIESGVIISDTVCDGTFGVHGRNNCRLYHKRCVRRGPIPHTFGSDSSISVGIHSISISSVYMYRIIRKSGHSCPKVVYRSRVYVSQLVYRRGTSDEHGRRYFALSCVWSCSYAALEELHPPCDPCGGVRRRRNGSPTAREC